MSCFRNQTKLIREGQEDKTKCYSALCYCYSKLDEDDVVKMNDLKRVDILQKTPVRVLHRYEKLLNENILILLIEIELDRRTVMTRPRVISDISVQLVDEHHFKIQMTTQAGTYVLNSFFNWIDFLVKNFFLFLSYVKEFVHGDLGRTEPSLCTILGKECDILELDVEVTLESFASWVELKVRINKLHIITRRSI